MKGTFASAKAFAAAKGAFASAKTFAAAKGGLIAVRPSAKKAAPLVRYSEALLRRDEGTIHTGKKIYFVSKSPVFVHRLFRNSNK